MQKYLVFGVVMAALVSGCLKHETSAPHAIEALDVRGENTRDIAASEFADGWSVHYDRFSLSPTFGIDETWDNRKGEQPLVGEEAYVYPVAGDEAYVGGGPRLELTEPVAVSAVWGTVTAGHSSGWGMRLRRPPATDEPNADASLVVSGEATGPDGQVVHFDWRFTYELTFSQCVPAGERELVLPQGGELDLHVALDGAALFGDQLAAGASLRFDALAQADADLDGTLTTDELRAVTLDELELAPGQYDAPGATSLHDFLSARLAYLVGPEYTCQVSADTLPG